MKTMKQDEMSERYKKCLVTVAMGLREECDIEKRCCKVYREPKATTNRLHVIII